MQGDLFEERGPDEVRLKLYKEEPAELRRPSDSFDKIVKMFEVEYEVPTIAFDVGDALGGWASEQQLKNAPAAPKVQRQQPKSTPAMTELRVKDPSRGTPILSAAAQAERQLFDAIIEDLLSFIDAEAAAVESGSSVSHIYKKNSAVSAVSGFNLRLHSVQLLHTTFSAILQPPKVATIF